MLRFTGVIRKFTVFPALSFVRRAFPRKAFARIPLWKHTLLYAGLRLQNNIFFRKLSIKFSEKKIFLIGGAKLFNYAFSKNLINGKIYETVFNCNFSDAATFIDPVSEKWKILSAKKLGENSCLFVRKKGGSADSFPTEINTPLNFQDNPASL